MPGLKAPAGIDRAGFRGAPAASPTLAGIIAREVRSTPVFLGFAKPEAGVTR